MTERQKAVAGQSTSRRRFLMSSGLTAGAAMTGLASFGRAAEQKLPMSAARSRGPHPKVRAALTGPWPSIHTPFTRDGDIDFKALQRMVDFVIVEGKAKAVVLTWGDSLYSLLTDDEIAEVTKAVCRHVNKRAMVVAADGIWWTGKEVAFAQYCLEVGADMLMVLPPDWAASATVDTLVGHYAAVAEQIPVMLVTNYLGKRGSKFAIELIGRLLHEVPGVMAVKDDVCGAFARKLCIVAGDRWVLSAGGQKQNHMDMVPYGVDGYLSTFMSFKPQIAWKYWNAIEAGDLVAAAAVIREYDVPLFDEILTSEGSFDAATHGILELAGLAGRWRRSPYYSLNDAQMEKLGAFLKSHNML